MYRLIVNVAIPKMTMFRRPVRNPAFTTTNGIASMPAPIVIPTNVAIDSREWFLDIRIYLVENYINFAEKK